MQPDLVSRYWETEEN